MAGEVDDPTQAKSNFSLPLLFCPIQALNHYMISPCFGEGSFLY